MAAVGELSSGANEMSAQVEEVVTSVKSLAKMADDLRQAISRFKLGGESDTAEAELVLLRRRSDWTESEPSDKTDGVVAYLRPV